MSEPYTQTNGQVVVEKSFFFYVKFNFIYDSKDACLLCYHLMHQCNTKIAAFDD